MDERATLKDWSFGVVAVVAVDDDAREACEACCRSCRRVVLILGLSSHVVLVNSCATAGAAKIAETILVRRLDVLSQVPN